MKRTLFQISDDFRALEQVLEECGGDVSDPTAEAALNAWEAELATDLEAKVDGYCSVIAEIEARIAAREEEATRLSRLAKVDRNVVESMRDRLLMVWQARGLGTVNTSRFRVSAQRCGGVAPLVIDGEQLEFARLVDRAERIVIR